MSDDWPVVRLGEYVRVKHGFAFRGQDFGDKGEHVVLTPGNFHDEGGFKAKSGTEKFYTTAPPPEYVLERNDLVIAMTEQAQGLLGSSALIPCGDRYLHNQRIGLVELLSQEVDRRFLYYLFNTGPVRAQIQATATGSKVRHTAPSRVEDVVVALPPLRIQRKIAAILLAYDDLVESNNRRIRILEEMAQRIYREWFVDFRYPGHEGIPLIQSELGPVPVGWCVHTTDDVANILGGGTPSREAPDYWDPGEVTWYTPTDLTRLGSMFAEQSISMISPEGLKKSSARLFPAGSVMMTSRATIGVTALNVAEAATNQGFITCVPRSVTTNYHLYYWIDQYKDTILALASGATFKEINKATFRKLPFLLAPPDIEQRFGEVVGVLGDAILSALRTRATLRAARDLLLPRLISGEIDVEGLEIKVSEAAA